MGYLLINARPSPFGRKVAIALIEKGIPFEVQYDVPWAESTCTPQFSPLEQLPILVTETGERIYDSTYLLEWIERRIPSPALLPDDVDGILYAKLLQTLGERLMEIAQNMVFELQRADTSQAWIDRQTRKILGGLGELERVVGERRVGHDQAITVGDIAVATTLLIWEFMVEAGFSPDVAAFRWRGRYKNLSEYVAVLETRPSFEQTRPETMVVDLQATVQ
jgi:glutathione S-transferase